LSSEDVSETEVFGFIQANMRSVWSVELLMLLFNAKPRAWRPRELVLELRSSDTAVTEALADLRRARLIAENPDGTVSYAPEAPDLDRIVAALRQVFGVKPMSVAKAISTAPSDRLRAFSDAFKLKGD
jgi:hypothetical protein